MPYNDGIDRLYCFSLTDLHDFEKCPFRFFVKHHLGKKYEIEESSEAQALGCLLDMSIKKFHESRGYGESPEYLRGCVMAAYSEIEEKVSKQSGPSFYSGILPLLTVEILEKATEIFQTYYRGRNFKIGQSLGEVEFGEWIIEGEKRYKLWGGADCLEMGSDGVPELVDYKSREDVEKGKNNMDMDLMPKIYTLLSLKQLQKLGFDKIRFIVRYWQDPLDETFFEEFDLAVVSAFDQIFKQKIDQIFETIELEFCEKDWCRGCKHEDRDKFVLQLEKHGVKNVQDQIDFFAPA